MALLALSTSWNRTLPFSAMSARCPRGVSQARRTPAVRAKASRPGSDPLPPLSHLCGVTSEYVRTGDSTRQESRNIPLKRLGTPDDVANLVSFPVSNSGHARRRHELGLLPVWERASYITGASGYLE